MIHVLHLKNPYPLVALRRGEGLEAELGVLHRHFGPHVYLVNLFDALEQDLEWLERQTKLSYPDEAALFADGWQLD